MSEPIRKKVDESWKEQVEQEKQVVGAPPEQPAAQPGPAAPERARADETEGMPEARLDLFVSGLAMDALISLGEIPHPLTKKQSANFPQAKYLIDLLGVLEDKTKGNLTVDEERLLKDALYQLRMRYLSKTGSPAT